MGNVRIAEMLHGGIDPDIVLGDHLRHNIYPPVPHLLDGAREAIRLMSEEAPDAVVDLDGVRARAADVVEGLHLDEFVAHQRETA